MIELRNLSKRYGDRLAVDDLTCTVQPGLVTGFLGPNGAGKSTTMRLILGLDRPSSGSATVDGLPYQRHPAPLRLAGALLEARGMHPGRTARDHLAALAATHGLPAARVGEVLDQVGLAGAARRRAGRFSLGMAQRLGIAAALLGDPEVLILDEPVNGLDPDGVLWVRGLLRGLAAQGRTVLVSSHLMSEMALTADRLLVVGRGRLVADCTVEEFIRQASHGSVRVRSPQSDALHGLLAGPGVSVTVAEPGLLEVVGLDPGRIGDRARGAGLAVHELAVQRPSLEEAFMALTKDSIEFEGSRR